MNSIDRKPPEAQPPRASGFEDYPPPDASSNGRHAPDAFYRSEPTRPTYLPCNFDAEPAAIRKLPHLVASLAITEEGKLDKCPLNPDTLRNAKTDDSDTWGDCPSARRAVESGKAKAAGPVLKRNGHCVIDMDGCTDAAGTINNTGAQDVIDRFPGCLVTRSVSGTGLHLWLKSKPPAGMTGAAATFHHQGQKVEILVEKFVAETWHPYGDTPGTIKPMQSQLDAFYKELKATEPRPDLPPAPRPNLAVVQGDHAAWARGVLDGEMRELRDTTVERNNKLNETAHTLARKLLAHGLANRPDIESMLMHEGTGIGLTHRECISTIRSGIESGLREPYTLPPPRQRVTTTLTSSSAPPAVHMNGHAPAGELPALPEVEPKTLEEVTAIFKKWLHLPDPGVLFVLLGTVAANLMDGDPVWLLLVGPPGGGKTEILNSVSLLPNVHMAATITEPALLSGTANKDKDKAAKGGLLRAIGPFGFLLLKDFTSILSMNREARAAVLAALREIYDGSWTRHVGVDGGKSLTWSGKVAAIAGCTPTIDSHHAVMAAMGERFALYRLPKIEEREQARRALSHAGKESRMRAEMAQAVAGLFAGVNLPKTPPELVEPELSRLIDLASLAVKCRSAVERDSYKREIELIPESEAPGRLALILGRLLAGMSAVGVDRAKAWEILVQVGLDSMPALRCSIFKRLATAESQLDTTSIATAVAYPTQTTRRSLEDLAAHGVVIRYPEGQGKADKWGLSRWAVERYSSVLQTFPEKSSYTRIGELREDGGLDVAPESLTHTDSDFSGKVSEEVTI